MIWEVEIHPNLKDTERERVCDEFDLLTHSERGGDLVKASSRGFLLEGEITRQAVERFCHDLLVDPVVENVRVSEVGTPPDGHCYTVLLQPGVMDPVSQSVLQAGSDLGISLQAVRTFRRYYGPADVTEVDVDVLSHKILANDAIEQVVVGPIEASHLALGGQYAFQPISVPLRSLDDAGLVELSKSGQLALNLDEMKTIQAYFAQQDRDPTDIELESIAQTWSEHCSHKTLRGSITYTETIHGQPKTRNIKNLLKETIFGATQELRQRWGDRDWCVSVFSDNAGVVQFLDDLHVCFKVETHNHPSAIEPYGGANTGIGGVVRDPMGTGRVRNQFAIPMCSVLLRPTIHHRIYPREHCTHDAR
ncbi:MAG: hypothetical protein R3B84_19195 [Zavarzinella sp.]